jgi:hypothetical protein
MQAGFPGSKLLHVPPDKKYLARTTICETIVGEIPKVGCGCNIPFNVLN